MTDWLTGKVSTVTLSHMRADGITSVDTDVALVLMVMACSNHYKLTL